jgi:hypothetical protein
MTKPTRYGDLIFLTNENGQIIHSAVYIAADLVFTKNGNNFKEPWVLMRMKDLLQTYLVTDPARAVAFRSKDS